MRLRRSFCAFFLDTPLYRFGASYVTHMSPAKTAKQPWRHLSCFLVSRRFHPCGCAQGVGITGILLRPQEEKRGGHWQLSSS